MYNLITYSIYLTIGAIIIFLVGRNLHKNGYHLILNLFQNELFTTTINNLLLVGYYLVNIGYLAITVVNFDQLQSLELVLIALADKIGVILLILGILHFNNIIILTLLSARKQQIIKLFNN